MWVALLMICVEQPCDHYSRFIRGYSQQYCTRLHAQRFVDELRLQNPDSIILAEIRHVAPSAPSCSFIHSKPKSGV